MLPDKFIERIKLQNYIDSGSLIKALGEPSPVSIRINPAKWDRRPVASEPVPWSSRGFYLDRRPLYTPDPMFHAGCYYPQEASSMFIEQLFRSGLIGQGPLRILDLCAAPGGKTTHLSSLAGPEALIVANDAIRTRARILAENVTKWGVPNTVVTWNDPSAFSRLEGFFDVILIDAPCSGEGMFRDSTAVSEWSEDNACHCSLRQRRILMDAWPALKEDGLLVYSTCTFNPSENEENIIWLAGKQNAESIRPDIPEYEGITEISLGNIRGFGFHPGRIKGEGLFISVLRKRESTGNVPKGFRGSKNLRPSKDDLRKAQSLSIFDSAGVLSRGNELFYFPGSVSEYELLAGTLRLVKQGTGISTIKGRDYLPSHELALSTGIRANAFPSAELTYEQAVRYLKREELKDVSVPAGWVLVTLQSVILGFVNNIGRRLNNYYPPEWRIRMAVDNSAGSKIIGWEDTSKNQPG